MPESPRRVDFTRRASREYLEGLLHISAENVLAATLVQERIEEALTLLERHPRLGRLGMVRGTREFPVTKTLYTIVYRIRSGGIEVLRVLHQRRLYP